MPHFEPATIEAVIGHMNGDHPDDNLLIARAFGDERATASTMVGLDERAGHWIIEVDGTERGLSVAWSATISERPEIRREIVALYDAACAKLGVTPRPHD